MSMLPTNKQRAPPFSTTSAYLPDDKRLMRAVLVVSVTKEYAHRTTKMDNSGVTPPDHTAMISTLGLAGTITQAAPTSLGARYLNQKEKKETET